jgi:hypothetical protein
MSMPDGESAPAFQDRNQSFGTGANGFQGETPAPVGSPGLAQQQARDNANNGGARVQMSGSGNGMSADQASSTMSGSLPTSNGQSQSTYEGKKWFEGRNQ